MGTLCYPLLWLLLRKKELKRAAKPMLIAACAVEIVYMIFGEPTWGLLIGWISCVAVAAILWRKLPNVYEGIGRCYRCGYNLKGNVSGRCPECGTTIANS